MATGSAGWASIENQSSVLQNRINQATTEKVPGKTVAQQILGLFRNALQFNAIGFSALRQSGHNPFIIPDFDGIAGCRFPHHLADTALLGIHIRKGPAEAEDPVDLAGLHDTRGDLPHHHHVRVGRGSVPLGKSPQPFPAVFTTPNLIFVGRPECAKA